MDINYKERLSSYKYITDSDDVRIKEKIKQELITNDDIIHVLNNKELEENDAENDEYFMVNIFPYYMIVDTQTSSNNFICYTVGYKNIQRDNKLVKILRIDFVILCERKNIIQEDTGIARHDLLAALIQNQFNYTNYFGRKIQLISDMETIVDGNYACRTLTFEQITDNNVTKTYGGTPEIINKKVVY